MYGDLLNGPPPGGAPPPPNAGPPLGAPPGAALGINAGAPPKMPGMIPPPTGKGAIPTGDPSTTKKEAADNAILALREMKGHYPSLATSADSMIDQIKSSSKASSAPKPGLGDPIPPGAPPADTSSTSQSGTPGGF